MIASVRRAAACLAAVLSILSVLLPLNAEAAPPTPASLADLEAQARARTTVQAYLPLTSSTAEAVRGAESFEPVGSGRVPNYLRALAVKPAIVKPFAHLIRTFTYEGALPPALKLAMAARIAQVNRSAYGAAHVVRLLRHTGAAGDPLLTALRTGQFGALPPADRLALRWAELQTQDIHGMTDEEFRQLRGYFSDSEVVELTFTVCFFNYFTRMVEGLGLPVESWVLDPTAKPAPAPAWTRDRVPARVALISDEEIDGTGSALQAARRPVTGNAGLGIGMANSQRAMLRVPALAAAWREFGAANGSTQVGRDILLQVSFAVSMANGCRYCTIHQVVGLRRIGVDATKLLAMEKDDSALTPRERTAVLFARKLTATPSAMTEADYAAIRRAFGEQGALEVLLQTCTFSFMNRFTDGLHLPSEDEAIRIYREVHPGK
ncbi:MAG: carboxymuconolactone decarboxylase family protein [Vicinamibacterales bacterium]